MFIRDWDKKEFDSEDKAFEDAGHEMILSGDIGDYLKPWVDYNDLLEWAMEQDGFFDVFEDELYKAQQAYFEDFYFELEDDEDENCECESENHL